MSDMDAALQHSLNPCITLGIKASSQMVVVLRDFLDYWYLQMSQTPGSSKYSEFLKTNKGAYFKDEMQFANVVFNLHQADIYREPVSKEERTMLQKMCRKMGIDYSLAKRPSNLEALVAKKYVYNQDLSKHEEKLVNAFICLDKNGNPVFEMEDKDGNRVPKIRDDEYLLTISEKDLPKWDYICTNLEAVGKRTLADLTRDSKAKETILANFEKNADPLAKEDPSTTDQPVKAESKEALETQAVDEMEPRLTFKIPKSRIIQEEKSNEKPIRITVKVTDQDFIMLPIRFCKPDDEKSYLVTIPESYPVEIISNKGQPIQRPVKDLVHQIPVTRSKEKTKEISR